MTVFRYRLGVSLFISYLIQEGFGLNSGEITGDGNKLIVDGEPTKLLLVQAVFRHGARTPIANEIEAYPNNPYTENTFPDIGIGQLTNTGKTNAHRIGLFLRTIYKNFLSKTYTNDEIYVRSTDTSRTKMSALLCLAGLYPPEKAQQWNENLLWQPIPYNYFTADVDDMSYGNNCPRLDEILKDIVSSSKFQKIIAPYKNVFDEVTYHTGKETTLPGDIFFIDSLFQAEKNYNRTTPDWAIPIMDKIKELTKLYFEQLFCTNELKRIGGGTMLQKMIENAVEKLRGTLKPEGRKIFLYSGHESNVAAILACSGVFKPHQPKYCSTYILELHKKLYSNTHVVRILYLADINKPPEVMEIKGCGKFCSIDRFIKLTRDSVTNNLQEICAARNPMSDDLI